MQVWTRQEGEQQLFHSIGCCSLLSQVTGGNQTLKLQVWGTRERELLSNPKQVLRQLQVHRLTESPSGVAWKGH